MIPPQISSPDRQQSQTLKLPAPLFMTVDHIGAILLPRVAWLRSIGRLAFPLFAFQLAAGCLHTRSVRRHALRLAAAGVIAQPVYVLAFQRGWWSLNIFATLFPAVSAASSPLARARHQRMVLLRLLPGASGPPSLLPPALLVQGMISRILWSAGRYGT